MPGKLDFALPESAWSTNGADFSLASLSKRDEIALAEDSDGLENGRYMMPRVYKGTVARPVLWQHAVDMVRDLKLEDGGRMFAIVSGNFVFGDVLEALVLEREVFFKTLTIQTLSMSKDNIDSLRRIVDVCNEAGTLERIRIALSDYFYSHERHVREGRDTPALVPYLYETLDDGDGKLDVAYAGVHTKITTFEAQGGLKCVIDGSANLRSSMNIEQFRVEFDADLHDWIEGYADSIFNAYSTINKSVRGGKLWHAVQRTP